MLGRLDDLNGGQVARVDIGTDGERYLGEADGSRIGIVGGAEDLEGLDHGVGHVGRAAVGGVGAEAEINLHKGRQVAAEPAWLEGDGAAADGPVCAVLCCVDSAA